MANYAHIVDGNIEGVYDLIPNNWKNISNFYALTEEELWKIMRRRFLS